MGKVVNFIDAGYLRGVMKDKYTGLRMNFTKLVREMAASDTLVHSYYYDSPPFQSRMPSSHEEQRKRKYDKQKVQLISKIPNFSYREGLIAKRWEGNRFRFEQKCVDVLIAMDMTLISLDTEADRFCLLAGDSDFIPAIEHARSKGLKVTLWHDSYTPKDLLTIKLLDACDEGNEITPSVASRITFT